MDKLTDYSGEFIQNLQPGDFSPETLAELLKLYAKLYIALDGFWYLTVKDRISNEEALACDIAAWEKVSKYEMKRITEALRIKGNDIVSMVKAMQLSPWFLHTKGKTEIFDGKRAVMMITYCPTLDALEKEGQGRENDICNTFEPVILKRYAAFFNPGIEVQCLKSPPRKSKDEICCQWEFSYGDK